MSRVSFDLPTFPTVEAERLHRQRRLVGALWLFERAGFDEGVAGHATVRDPERLDHFWVNPLGANFAELCVEDLILVDATGNVVIGDGSANPAALAIHTAVHRARPDVNGVVHLHSQYGKAWSSLGRLLDPITQDACAFYESHSLFARYGGLVLSPDEGADIAKTLGQNKAIILQNHGLLTVGQTIDEAASWFIAMERCCHVQLLAEAAGRPNLIDVDDARETASILGMNLAGWFAFKPLWERVCRARPELAEVTALVS